MPASTPKNAGQKPDADRSIQYVKCDLTVEQKALLVEFSAAVKEPQVLAWLAKEVENGHVVSLRSNETGYQCSVTGVRPASGHDGIALISRASTPIRSVHSAMFKDTVILKGAWSSLQSKDALDF